MKRLVISCSSDLISAVTRGKTVTLKHFLIGVGLHNITGLKTPIKILSHLDHCIDYNLVCEIETAQAEEALKCLEETQNDSYENEKQVLTYWWTDIGVHDAIDSTHIFSRNKSILQSTVLYSYLLIQKESCNCFLLYF